MIGKLRGIVDGIFEDHVLIDVGGVGYVVFCSRQTLEALPANNGPVALHIDTHVREDHIHLYGFAEADEREWFRLLQNVQGVGARVALAILSVLSPVDLLQAIVAADKASIARANGVGPRLAARIIGELKDKVANFSRDSEASGVALALAVAGAGPTQDAVSALVNLGYRRVESMNAIAAASQALGPDASVESLITSGLRELAR